jgi:hypothetical protein
MREHHFIKHPKIPALLLFMIILALPGGEARSSDDAASRRSLAGIKGFSVYVERIDPEIEGDGLRAGALQSDAEGLLKGLGLRVLSKMDRLDEPGEPRLYINVNVLKLRATNEYVYSLRTAFQQNAFLTRAPIEVLGASTWSLGLVTGITYDLGKIRDSVKAQVQTFGEAFRSANPR